MKLQLSCLMLLFIHCDRTQQLGFDEIAEEVTEENNVEDADMNINEHMTQNRSGWQKFPISYIPIIECSEDIWQQAQLSQSEKYDALHAYPPKHSLDHLIETENIEVIINENDNIATTQFINAFVNESFTKSIQFDAYKFYSFYAKMGGNLNLSANDFDTDSVDFNGYGSTYWNADPLQGDIPSTGMNAEYFKMDRNCASLKNCNVYPIFRVVHKSLSSQYSFSCNDIMNKLLPPIYECIDENWPDDECPMLIDSGYFKDVFKVKVAEPDRYVVVKLMRPQKYDDFARDVQRNVRESILLHYLQREETEFIEQYGADFVSQGQQRAFPYVRELGHCLYPTYISGIYTDASFIDICLETRLHFLLGQ